MTEVRGTPWNTTATMIPSTTPMDMEGMAGTFITLRASSTTAGRITRMLMLKMLDRAPVTSVIWAGSKLPPVY